MDILVYQLAQRQCCGFKIVEGIEKVTLYRDATIELDKAATFIRCREPAVISCKLNHWVAKKVDGHWVEIRACNLQAPTWVTLL
jgi:hypothetical protein